MEEVNGAGPGGQPPVAAQVRLFFVRSRRPGSRTRLCDLPSRIDGCLCQQDGIERFEFADGTILSDLEVANLAVEGTFEGDNILTTTPDGGVLDGGAGNRAEVYGRILRTFLREPPPMPQGKAVSATELARITARLNRLVPLLKAPVLQACVDCVLADGHVSAAEAEMLRVVAALLRCPLPPLLAPENAP